MEGTPARSLAGAARRSRRLQGTPSGHTGSATTASGSPYARPTLKRDSSSQALAALESGDRANGSIGEASKLDRRKTVGGTDGIFGRVRRGLGWLVGRAAEPSTEESDSNNQVDKEQGDEESMLAGSTRPRSRAAPVATPRASSSLARNPPLSLSKRDYAGPPSILSHDGPSEADESSAAKKLRTSHSTLNLPRKSSPPKGIRQSHSSAGPTPGRALSPGRPLSPRLEVPEVGESHKRSIFASGPLASPAYNKIAGTIGSSRRSVSPGGLSQFALASQPTSGASSAFGLQSQSPFRAGGHSARSPDLAALNISSGLARSPSLPAERLLNLQRPGSRLYPYQRSPSNLSGLARPNAMATSRSVGSGLSGNKRDYNAMSVSPQQASPRSSAFFRGNSNGLHPSPTGTDFSTDFSHRNKRQRVSIAWHPEKGFISTDVDGNPLRSDDPPALVPKNEAERILERLENIRRPQIDGLRSSSPRRLNVPLPTSTPGKGSIFATRISSSRTEPSLAAAAISPYARRQQAYREERALRRDIINSRGGLGEHLRTTQSQHNYPPPEATEDIDSPDETAETRAEEEQASTFSGEEDDTQPKPSGRRTRQRTRELSVMSDTSVDDAAASLRRSTRIRKKPQDTEHQSPQRVRKSAKSPPPVATKDTSRKSKARKNPVANEGQNDAEMDEDRTSKPASPGRGRSPDAESAPNKRFATTPQKNMSIDQVLAEGPPTHEGSKEKATIPQPSAREQRLSTTVARRTRGFSAKDDVDEMVETSSSTTEQPKLKLPNSVFANRFSFGRSPSSSLLASPSRTTFEEKASSQTKATETAESQSSATTLPKLALPSSAMLSGTGSSTVAGGSSPSVSFAGASQRSPAPPTAMPQASALKATPSQEGPTPASKPLFSFTAPANDTAKVSQSLFQAPAKEGQSVVSNSQTSFFDAGASSTHTSAGTPDDTTGGVTAPFAFASSSNKEKSTDAAPAFTFGKRATEQTTPETIPTIDLSKPSNPFASFPSPNAAPSAATKEATPAATVPAFSFGAPPRTASAATIKPTTEGTAGTSGLSKAASSAPAFSFGATLASGASAFGNSSPAVTTDGTGMQSSPPPASSSNDKAANSPFSPVIQASKAPSFSFGQNPSGSATPAAQTTAPAFSFGAQASGQGDTKSRSASPFSVGAPAQPFAFGNQDASAKPVAGAFTFGAPAPKADAKEADKPPTSSGGFNFGTGTPGTSTGSAPAFSFGATKAPTSNPFAAVPSVQAPTGAFGSATPAVTPGAQAAFGQNNANGSSGAPPAFSFGAQANGASSAAPAPSFSFGGSNSTTPAASSTPAFAFGAGNAGGAVQPFVFGGANNASAPTPPAAAAGIPSFNFSAASAPGTQPGSPAGTPTGMGPSGGSFFTMGAGDTPTSPNKARRPVKPLRRPR